MTLKVIACMLLAVSCLSIVTVWTSWLLKHPTDVIPTEEQPPSERLCKARVTSTPVTAKQPWRSKTGLQTRVTCKEKYKLLIIINSEAKNYLKRASIRATWGKSWRRKNDLPKWKSVFLLGRSNSTAYEKSLLKEQDIFGDLVMADFQDTFHNLTLKVIMGFEWATEFCQHFDYIFKTDDDVFVNIPNVFKFLSQPDIPNTKLFAGHVHFEDKPMRSGKYEVTEAEYPYDYYPRFAAGGGFVVSKDVASILVATHNEKNYFKLDDVHLGLLALSRGIDMRHDRKFYGIRNIGKCVCHNDYIVLHGANTIWCMMYLYSCDILMSNAAPAPVNVTAVTGTKQSQTLF